MTNIFNLKSDWIYWFLGILFSGVLLIVVFYSLSFLVGNFNIALNTSLIQLEPVAKFNLEKLKDLGI